MSVKESIAKRNGSQARDLVKGVKAKYQLAVTKEPLLSVIVEMDAYKATRAKIEAYDEQVDHLLCRKHSERTLKEKLSGDACKRSFEHLYKALYYRFSEHGCLKEINAAISQAPESTKDYIRKWWLDNRRLWAYYACQHSCLLLQVTATNPVESWHHSLKIHAQGKGRMLSFSLSAVAMHTLKIANQWELREEETATKFKTYQAAERQMYPQLAKFSGPIQQFMVGQLKKAMEAQNDGEYRSFLLLSCYPY